MATEVAEALETEFVMALVKAIAIPLLMCLLIPFVQQLIDDLQPKMEPVLGPAIVATAEPWLVMLMYPLLYGPDGQQLIDLCTNALEARLSNFLIRSLAFHVPRVLQAEIPPRLTEYMLNEWAPQVSKALLYDVLHALTHSLSSSLSHHLAQAVTQGVTHSITHQLIHYYYCIYCYTSGEFCRYCYYYNDWLGMSKQAGTSGRYGRVEETIV